MKRTLAGFGVALALLALLATTFDVAAVGGVLAGADLPTFVLGVGGVALALGCWAEAQRRLLVASGREFPPAAAIRASLTGTFGKQVLPMGHAAGTAVMTYAFERQRRGGYDRTLAVVVVADVLSLAASLSVAVAGLAYLLATTPPSPTVRALQGGVLVAVGVAAALVTGFVYRRRTVTHGVAGLARLLRGTVGRLSPRVARALAPATVDDGLARFYDTFDAVTRNRRALAEGFGLTLVGWVLFALPLYTSGLAVGVRLPLALALLLVPLAGVTTAFPLPGGLGGFELALGSALVALVDLPVPEAAAVVLLYRLCSFWFVLLVGGAVLATGSGSLRDLTPSRP